MWILNWIQHKLGFDDLKGRIKSLEVENQRLLIELKEHKRFVVDKIHNLKDYTRVDADVGFRGNNTIILTGIYRKQAYVHFYDVGEGEFQALVRQMKDMKDHALIRNIDAPPSFKGTFEI